MVRPSFARPTPAHCPAFASRTRPEDLLMCGFCGEIRFDDRPIDLGALNAVNQSMEPRGPDGSGLFQQGRIALGHRRLSIIDLSSHAS